MISSSVLTMMAAAALVALTAALVALTAALHRLRGRLRGARAEARELRDDRDSVVRSLRRDLEERETILAAMGEGVWLFDPGGRLAYANAAARAMMGGRFGSVSEVSPRTLRELITRASRGRGGDVPDSRRFETAERVVEAAALPAAPAGTVLVILRDVTRAVGVERLRRDFVANASHELKTPVASILAISNALRAAAGRDETAEARFLQRLDQEAERLAALVRDLLELHRLETGTDHRRLVRLDRVVATVVERTRWRAERSNLRLGLDPGTRVVVRGSEDDLANMVQNLLDNAVRYTPRGGVVTVTVRRHDASARVSVSDTGIGVASRDVDRIFERFYRADAARSRETGGTGLGLSIVRHVAEAHGGTVECRSTLGAGSTFTVTLPLVSDGTGSLPPELRGSRGWGARGREMAAGTGTSARAAAGPPGRGCSSPDSPEHSARGCSRTGSADGSGRGCFPGTARRGSPAGSRRGCRREPTARWTSRRRRG